MMDRKLGSSQQLEEREKIRHPPPGLHASIHPAYSHGFFAQNEDPKRTSRLDCLKNSTNGSWSYMVSLAILWCGKLPLISFQSCSTWDG